MKDFTKVDIIMDQIHCYNEITNERKQYALTSEFNPFIQKFSDTQDLLTINVSDPTCRIIKFYKIEDSVPQSFVELNFEDMSRTTKNIFTEFIEILKSK